MAPPLPIPESYWVVPGLLLAGEYPYSFVEEEGRGRLRAFLDAGIRLFVDLTEAKESGRTGPLDPYAEALLEEAAARGLSVRTVRHPVRDMSVPAGRRPRADRRGARRGPSSAASPPTSTAGEASGGPAPPSPRSSPAATG